jgi:hypothetical protein
LTHGSFSHGSNILGIEPEPAGEAIAVRLASILVFEPDVSSLIAVRTAIIKTVKVVHTGEIELDVEGPS